jgi:hypothetical protein
MGSAPSPSPVEVHFNDVALLAVKELEKDVGGGGMGGQLGWQEECE